MVYVINSSDRATGVPVKQLRLIRKLHGDHDPGASLILLGMPGTRASGLARVFSLDERFFTKQIEQYESL